MDIRKWLRELDLERYAEAFIANEIDAEILPRLTAEDLKDLGVMLVGHRRKLLDAVAGLRDEACQSQPKTTETLASPSEAERRQLTVMFVDLVGSTGLAARLDPEDMGAAIRAYQDCCTKVIKRWDGHIAKYMGDGVLAYFGYPQAHEDEAERAVRAGLAIIEALAGLRTPGGEPVAARVGIATGLVMVGELIGEGAAKEQMVVGDTPNLAARLQALATPGSVVIGGRTRRLLGGLFELDELGPLRLKGFTEPFAAWRVKGKGRAEGRFEALRGDHLTPLVGREHELGILMERWAWAKDGDGQVVLLSGEPGIGKSRLARALRERLANEAYTPLSHYCSPYHTNSALYPVVGLLERATRRDPGDPPEEQLAKLEAALAHSSERPDEIVPLLAALLGIQTDVRYPAPTLTPEMQKRRTLQALVDQLAGLAVQQPVLALYEDVHWIDPSTLELLNLVVERVRQLSVLVLVTFRPEFQPPWTGQAHVTTLTMSRLGRRQGAALVARITGDKPLPDEIVDQVVARTDGVPLFVEELTKTVLESGLLADAGDHYELSGALPPLAIPTTLHDSLMARLDRLAPIKEVAQIGAVIGREFSHELLAAVTDRPEADLCIALEQLVDSGLIFRRGAQPEASYSFKHSLVQDAAYQSLLKSRRQQLHARIAEVLNAPATAPELLAHHLTEAGLIEEALVQWLAAGERALARSAYREAAGHLHRGLELVERLPPSPARIGCEIRFQIAMGQAQLPLRGAEEAETAFARARLLCAGAHEPKEQFRAIWGQWFCNYHRMNVPQMRVLTSDLLASAQRETDAELALQAHHAAWASSYVQGLLSEARQHAEAGLRLYDPESHHLATGFYAGHDAGVCSRYTLGFTLSLMGYPDRAMAVAQEAVDLARRLKHPLTLSMALTFAGMVHQLRRDFAQTRAFAREDIALCREQQLPVYLAASRILDAWVQRTLDDSTDAVAEIEDGIALALKHGSHVRRPFYLGLYADLCLASVRPAQGLAAIEEAIALADAGGERWYLAELCRIKGLLLLQQDRANRAVAQASFERALETARDQRAGWFELRAATSLARLWRDHGERAVARDLLAPVYGWFTEGFDTADLKDARALLDQLE